jgi:hypothetical protein
VHRKNIGKKTGAGARKATLLALLAQFDWVQTARHPLKHRRSPRAQHQQRSKNKQDRSKPETKSPAPQGAGDFTF